jgi:hypothetical protein
MKKFEKIMLGLAGLLFCTSCSEKPNQTTPINTAKGFDAKDISHQRRLK